METEVEVKGFSEGTFTESEVRHGAHAHGARDHRLNRRQPRFGDEIGAGLHLSPNGMKVLNALGLEHALASVAARPRAISTKHFRTGVANFEGPLDDEFERRFGAPFYSFHRADLHAALSRAVLANDTGCIAVDYQAVDIVEGDDDVTVEFENGTAKRTEILIAADGVHSRVRASIHGEIDARFTGHVAYRGMVATETLPADFVEPKLNVWVGPGKHFVAYPVRRGELTDVPAKARLADSGEPLAAGGIDA